MQKPKNAKIPADQQTLKNQANLRNKARTARLALSPLQQKLAAKRLKNKVLANTRYRNARHIAFYFSVKGELNTALVLSDALKKNKNCYLPSVNPGSKQLAFFRIRHYNKLKKGSYDIPHLRHGKQILATKLDLVIMPLVAFDSEGKRLGMGGGYYDYSFRHLSRVKKVRKTYLLGVAHKCQQVAQIEANAWDLLPDKIISV